MKQRDAGFVFGALTLAVIIAIIAYYVLFAPTLAARSDALAAAEEARAFNDTLEIQLIAKQGEFEKLPEYEAQIEEIATELPPQDDFSGMRREIEAILADETLTVTQEAANPAVLVQPGVVTLSAQAYAVGRTSYIEGLAFQNVYQTQWEVTIVGPYPNAIAAIARLQMNDDRYYLVAGLELVEATRLAPEEPATFTLTIHAFTLYDPDADVDAGGNAADVDPDTGEAVPPPTLANPGTPLLDPVG